jgi:thioredoxin reductase
VNVDVLIAGAGPAGLAAAIELRKRGVSDVLVVDREQEAGGIPRHCAHTGYGLRDLHRLMNGPAYARHYRLAASAAGVTLRTGTTLTGWPAAASELAAAGSGTLAQQAGTITATLTSQSGIEDVHARAVLLATGCRERPRSARLVPGSRPAGVMTTGELQQRVYLHGQRLTGHALIVGAEHVSFSAMLTLMHAGAKVTALVTDQPRHQSFAAFRLGAQIRWRVPVWTRTTVAGIAGRDEVSAVILRDERDGSVRTVPCELVVFSGDWIPDHELARLAGTELDPGTRGPAVDTALSTSVPGMFAAGNLVHAAETADVAALSGRHAAAQVAAYLDRWPVASAERAAMSGQAGGRREPVPVMVAEPLLWISPNGVSPASPEPPRGQFVLRSGTFANRARLEVRQNGRLLKAAHARLVPGRSIRLDGQWARRVDPTGGPVQVTALQGQSEAGDRPTMDIPR